MITMDGKIDKISTIFNISLLYSRR